MTETLFFLMAQFGPRAVIPLDEVRKEYFSHLEPHVFIRKLAHGEIPLPLLRIEASQKSTKGIYMIDLAIYIDSRREEAEKERQRLAKIF
ncbi:pyocin activator PrtN family protein [Burkholderia ubonensis]|uniref:pyocin activator PrtN family protein n=1 Tax=Burkholderia ubonensis TaxID=101571 RepID=UPI00076CB144|nr:pyocin activator PrtN family protein [Burkholderia ubonensis]KVO10270.1 Pyocin activator protein PrtN [Burkholderia ubonensis]